MCELSNIQRSLPMPIETIVAHHAIENKHAIDKRSPIGNWEIYSWGDGNFPGMAAISAITALQIGATLSPVPADKVALNKAAEYLLDALASQLKSFHQALNARADRANDERTRSYPSLSQRIGPGCSGRV
jgi:hypothetical protein